MSIVTLTTDFGLHDWFVGTMKAVILNLARQTKIIDITHGIPAGDIRAGAFALRAAYRFFPPGTIHVAVVDPGVGGDREALAVQTADYLFLGPDNGVLSFALEREKVKALHRLENKDWFLLPVSRTFHGRDVFAPVAAHLSQGASVSRAGRRLKGYLRLSWPQTVERKGQCRGEVVYIDRFGNAITNMENTIAGQAGRNRVVLRGQKPIPVGSHYSVVPPGKPVVVPGSSGFLEVAINGGNAAKRLGLRTGSRITLSL